MSGYDHYYKQIRLIWISCLSTFNEPQLIKSKYDDREDNHRINKNYSRPEKKKADILTIIHMKNDTDVFQIRVLGNKLPQILAT